MKNLITNIDIQHMNKLQEHFGSYLIPLSDPTIRFHAIKDNTKITCYTDGSLLISGHDSQNVIATINSLLNDIDFAAIGLKVSGLDDYFGPIVCVCTYLSLDIIKELKKDKNLVNDEFSDFQITQLAPYLMRSIKHAAVIMEPSTFHSMLETKNLSRDKILSLFVNQSLTKGGLLKEGIPVITDEFMDEATYYNCLGQGSNNRYNMSFHADAINRHLSVKVSHIIGRYMYLNKLQIYNKIASEYLIRGKQANAYEQLQKIKSENINLAKKIAIF